MVIQYLQSFMAGLLISLVGSLPPSNLNVAAMQIAVKETFGKALWFSLGVIVIEMIYLGIILNVIGRFTINNNAATFFRIVSVVFLLVLAVSSLSAIKAKEHKNIILDNKIKRSVLGATMSAVNPMQVPFWMGWIIYLLSRSLLINSASGVMVFVLSTGIGTFIALLFFIYAGKTFSEILLRKQKQVNMVAGCLFIVLAVAQLFKVGQ
jgi:threonine/homoserine/homoserine lactone efflux protein